jgi:hypothetical protein
MFGGDMRTEDEKLSFALEMAFNEISKDKDAGDADETQANQSMAKESRKKGPIGTNALIKLPYVIGTEEFAKHPYAGLVYLNMGGGLEQDDLHKDELLQLQDDKLHELEVLQKNAEEQQ